MENVANNPGRHLLDGPQEVKARSQFWGYSSVLPMLSGGRIYSRYTLCRFVLSSLAALACSVLFSDTPISAFAF